MTAADWWSEDQVASSRSYLRPKARARLIRAVTAAAVVATFVLADGPRRLLDSLGIGSWMIGVVVMMLALEVLLVPIAAAHDVWLHVAHDRRFGRSNVRPLDELGRQAKTFVFRAAVHTIVLLPLFWLMRTAEHWWIPAWVLLAILATGLGWLVPLLAPVLRPTTALDSSISEPLHQSFDALGSTVAGFDVFDDTSRPRIEPGYFTRNDGKRRVVVHASRLGLPSVALAHAVGELGARHALGLDRRRTAGEVALGLVLFGSLAVVSNHAGTLSALDASGPGDPVLLPALAATALVVRFASGTVKATVTRRLARRADQHLLITLGDPGAFIAAQRFTAELLLDDLDPRGLNALLRPAPSAAERMAAARDRSRHGSGVSLPPSRPSGGDSHQPAPKVAR